MNDIRARAIPNAGGMIYIDGLPNIYCMDGYAQACLVEMALKGESGLFMDPKLSENSCPFPVYEAGDEGWVNARMRGRLVEHLFHVHENHQEIINQLNEHASQYPKAHLYPNRWFRARSESVYVEIQTKGLIRGTEKAILVKAAVGNSWEDVWLPRSKVVVKDEGKVLIPEWLAQDRGIAHFHTKEEVVA